VGAVAMAHPGGFDPNDAKLADSQMYIMLGNAPKLDGSFTVFGQVISGMDVVRKLAVTDRIRRITVKS
jgi:cyclophilin family peptidyl-prolyl cis-trans isomerase